MSTDHTTKYSLPFPDGTEDVKDGDDAIGALADAVDGLLTPFSSGTLAARPVSTSPSPGIAGRSYLATDVGPSPGTLYLDYGTGWIEERAPVRAVRVERTTGVALSNSVETEIPFTTVDFDTDSLHTGGSGERITVPTNGDGLWEVWATVEIFIGSVSSSGHLNAYLYQHHTTDTLIDNDGFRSASTGVPFDATRKLHALVPAVAGDYFHVHAYQDVQVSAGALATGTFSARRVGPAS